MTALIIAAFSLAPPPLGPSAPAGSSAAFQRAVLAVQKELAEGRFDRASALLDRLPSLRVSLEWDDSQVPAPRRPEFARARDEAIRLWKEALPGLEVTLGQRGAIRVSFVDSLPPNPDSPGPAGAVFFSSLDPSEPALEAVIALHRTARKRSIEAREVSNEVLFAIGSFLGLERLPGGGCAMCRQEHFYQAVHSVSPLQTRVARANLRVLDELRAAARDRKRLTPAEPVLVISPKELVGPPVVQGEQPQFTLTVTNRGNAPASLGLVPDCGCLSIRAPSLVEPGQTVPVLVTVDTTDFPNGIDKKIYVLAADPDLAGRFIPVRFDVEPRFRFLHDIPASTLIVDPERGARASIFLAVNPDRPLEVLEVQTTGVPALVEFAEWSGSLPDPERGEPARERRGYRIDVALGGSLPVGRSPLTLQVITGDEQFRLLTFTIWVQSGITALPAQLYLGEVGSEPARGWVFVSRPGRPFRILGVEADSPHLRASVEETDEPWEFKVIVEYDGRAEFGNFRAKLRIRTDDPDQSVIEVPVSAIVR